MLIKHRTFKDKVLLCTPFFIGLCAIWLSALPNVVLGSYHIFSSLPLMVIYYWRIHAPNMLPLIAVAGLGVFHDLTHGFTPAFLYSVIYLSTYAIITAKNQYILKAYFLYYLAGFGAISLLENLITWLAFGAPNLSGNFFDKALLWSIFSLGLFPIFSLMMNKLKKIDQQT